MTSQYTTNELPERQAIIDLVLKKPIQTRDVAIAMGEGWDKQRAYNVLKRLRDTNGLIASKLIGNKTFWCKPEPRKAQKKRELPVNNGTTKGRLKLDLSNPYRAGSMDAYSIASKGTGA
jgi:hypothetical protein